MFQPLAFTKALPHYLIMEISNDKRLEVEVTLDMKKVHFYSIVISCIFIHWKEVPPDQVPMSICELYAVKVFIFGDKDGLKKGVL